MFSLSRESENSLKRGILKLIQDFLQSYFKPKPRILGLITQDELQTELNIKYGTVKRWEQAGLKTIHATNRRHAHCILQN